MRRCLKWAASDTDALQHMLYASTATHPGDAAMGMPSHLFYHPLRRASLQCAGECCRLESGM